MQVNRDLEGNFRRDPALPLENERHYADLKHEPASFATLKRKEHEEQQLKEKYDREQNGHAHADAVQAHTPADSETTAAGRDAEKGSPPVTAAAAAGN